MLTTTGDLLKQKRLFQKLSLEEIEKQTKIRKKFLEALEEGNLDALPGETYTYGFVKNYAQILGLSETPILAMLRREYQEKEEKAIIPNGMAKPLVSRRFFFQKITIPGTFLLAVIILSIYLFTQYRSLEQGPQIFLEYPKENITINSESIVVKGTTDKEAKLSINGQEISLLENGKFNQEIKLLKGENLISLIAVNKQGKETKIERIINRK